MTPYVFEGVVTRWIDGDTVEVDMTVLPLPRLMQPDKRIRLLRVDTPERGEPLYDEARLRAEQLAPAGSIVLVHILKQDSFGRTLANVYNTDGISIADQLLVEGLGVIYQRK